MTPHPSAPDAAGIGPAAASRPGPTGQRGQAGIVLAAVAGDPTPKGLRADAQRAVTPAATLARVRPLFERIGLTRLADITGLDVIGIPVVLSVRPQAGYLSVDGGKGFTREAAMASAAMECFERHAGERTPVPSFPAAWAQLPADQRIERSDLPLSRNSLFHPMLTQRWVWAEDLADPGAQVAVPSVMVSLERHRHPRSSVLPFSFSSNGLNSGNTKSEALVGALYEVIERDATTCSKVAWNAGAPMRRVDLGTATSPDIATLVEATAAAGIEVVVVDATVDTAVPTFNAYLADLRNPGIGVYHGYGTHLDPQVAVIRAICEAAQGRLVFIAGSRDDSFRHKRRLHSAYAQANEFLTALPAQVDLADFPDESCDTFQADGEVLRAKLAAIGIERVLAVDLTHPDVGVDVMRVIVPGLEGYMLEDFTPGRRAQQHAHAALARDSAARR
jgi:ribosomal protein S12 methylthiotransferase accessory factor